jgi:hypothetical protein
MVAEVVGMMVMMIEICAYVLWVPFPPKEKLGPCFASSTEIGPIKRDSRGKWWRIMTFL